jgi:hypothetical protein
MGCDPRYCIHAARFYEIRREEYESTGGNGFDKEGPETIYDG